MLFVVAVIAVVSFFGMSVFGTWMWAVYLVLAAVEGAAAWWFWRRRRSRVLVGAFVVLAVIQAGQAVSYFAHRVSVDSMIPIDNFLVLFACLGAAFALNADSETERGDGV